MGNYQLGPYSVLAMRILALETSSEQLSVALATETETFVRDISAGQRHSSLALDAIGEVLLSANLTINALDAIAYGQGPGSFVGIRIACALAQGMALGAAKPMMPVATTLALAEQAVSGGSATSGTPAEAVLVVIDARLGEFYVALYRLNPQAPTGWDTAIAPMLATAQSLPALSAFIAMPNTHCVGIGSAFAVPALRETLLAKYGTFLSHVVEGALPRARDVASIARRQFDRVGAAAFVDAEHAAPLYLRDNVAQTIEERHARKMSAPEMLATRALVS
jgi:tRNA threonylcarbamoyladenosine biosynthesis protein TsaB